ncbi:hypothetical protein EII19_05380 [Comamonadaceae bacterium OH2310_COT-174]|nr:hypothetical protein EII19_05380 [Comamonadaceae bacterium OH2310_COT-174]
MRSSPGFEAENLLICSHYKQKCHASSIVRCQTRGAIAQRSPSAASRKPAKQAVSILMQPLPKRRTTMAPIIIKERIFA